MSTTTDTSIRRARPAVIAVCVALVLSAGAALFFGVSWALAAGSQSVTYAQERDQVQRVGSQDVINFNTLDYRKVQQGLDLWVASSTGPLHDEVMQGRQANADKITQAKATTQAEVLDSAVTELDDRAGKARMIAVVRVTVTPDGQPPSVKRSRYQAELTRDGDGQWRLSGLSPVDVG